MRVESPARFERISITPLKQGRKSEYPGKKPQKSIDTYNREFTLQKITKFMEQRNNSLEDLTEKLLDQYRTLIGQEIKLKGDYEELSNLVIV